MLHFNEVIYISSTRDLCEAKSWQDAVSLHQMGKEQVAVPQSSVPIVILGEWVATQKDLRLPLEKVHISKLEQTQNQFHFLLHIK